jgi:hypothetical protein
LLNLRRKKKYAARLVPPAFIDVNRDAKVSIQIGVRVPWGGESNPISSANVLAGENSKSIAPEATKPGRPKQIDVREKGIR